MNCTPFHSNGFASVANGNNFGATSAESFNQRNEMNRNRQTIGSYDQSFLGRQANMSIRPKPVRDANNRAVIYHKPSLNMKNNQRTFQEPAGRLFNPFSH